MVGMTPVGHSLMGLCFGALAVPRRWQAPEKLLGFAAFALLANAPDVPLPFWGHNKYLVSHSIFVNSTIVTLGAVLLARWSNLRRAWGGWAVVFGGAAAWLSHLPLDSFYNHGYGIRIFWPVSLEALRLPIPWFEVLPRGWSVDLVTLKIAAIEFAFYGALLGICLFWRLHQKRA